MLISLCISDNSVNSAAFSGILTAAQQSVRGERDEIDMKIRKRVASVVLGCAIILAALGYIGNAFQLWDFKLFFDGWWTLFILIPCICSMIEDGIRWGNAIGFFIGAALLTEQQKLLPEGLLVKLILPLIMILIGLKIIFRKPAFEKKHSVANDTEKNKIKNFVAVFGGDDRRITGPFYGANITAVFGGVELDLREAKIERDITISCISVFGGIDLLLPENVQCKVKSLPIFGGVDEKHGVLGEGMPTVYIDATSIFGGTDIK